MTRTLDRDAFAACIDQTLLAPTAGLAEAREWMRLSADRGFAALCVAPIMVAEAAATLAESTTRVCSVCGFPLGYATTVTKAAEARELVRAGCEEVDMVMAIGRMLEGDLDYVMRDIAEVVAAVAEQSDGRALVKVILETGYLSSTQVSSACTLAEGAGARFVKTSTGFGPRGASVEDVRVMREAVGGRLGIKAAGGIRDLDAAIEMLNAGATRLGTSSGIQLLEAFAARQA